MDNESKTLNSNNKFTNEDLKTMQSWDLDHKIAVSLTRIAEFYAKFPHEIYVLCVLIILILSCLNSIGFHLYYSILDFIHANLNTHIFIVILFVNAR